jgi:hypothetical protein
VHRGGIADFEFRKLTDGHPDLKLINEGKMIVLSGDLVREFVEEAVLRGDELVKFIENWLPTNAE